MKIKEIVEELKERIRDIEFREVRKYKEERGIPIVAHFPVYAPHEIFHSLWIFLLGLNGAGNEIEIMHADARFGSFICSIVKSTMELGMTRRLDFIDGFFFTGICDAARNLAYVYKRNAPEKEIIFIHLPQNPETDHAVDFLVSEYRRLIEILERISGRKYSEDRLRESIRLYNENRGLQRELLRVRRKEPGKLSLVESYAVVRAGNYMMVEEHNSLLRKVLALLEERTPVERDRVRVVIEGSFCEQPPFELLEVLDDVGCHVLDDDLIIGRRLITEDIPEDGDPLRNLAEAFIKKTRYFSVRHSGKKYKSDHFVENVKRYNPDAVIFMYAKFCEPGLFDYVLFKRKVEEMGLPYLFLEFEEKMWNFDRMRLELETFLESLLFAF